MPSRAEGKLWQGNLDAADLIVQAFGSENRTLAPRKGSGAGGSRGGAEEIAAARGQQPSSAGAGADWAAPCGADGFFGGCGLQPSPQALDFRGRF